MEGAPAPDRPDEALYEALFAPLVPHLRYRRLVLVPHDELHFLPFAALRDPVRGRYLIETYRLTYVPSASALRQLQERTRAETAGAAVVLGDPAIGEAALSSLTGARSEAEAVADLLGVEPLVGGAATEEHLRCLVPTARLVHLATHGVLRPEDPRFSYLALAAGGGHDGRLEMGEVFEELDLGEASLVVLSACQTALGERSGGDEVVGLVRAFLYAGSSAVLATLWEVDDFASAELMRSFYRHLLAGESASQALAAAQVEMLQRPGKGAPYYWAGYTLIGETRLFPSFRLDE